MYQMRQSEQRGGLKSLKINVCNESGLQ